MRAAIITAPGRLELVDLPDPQPKRDEVVVRVTACGICGTDLHVSSHTAPSGTVLGHEIAGVVEEVGPDVDSAWRTGTEVVVRPLTGCGTCTWCRRDRPDHCDRFLFLGMDRAGGYAERVLVRSTELFEAPVSLGPVDQALVEPLAVARRGLRRGAMLAGETVVVLGCGPIGLAVTSWAHALGAGRIVATDPVAERRVLAERLGADVTVAPELLGDVLTSAPLVVECTGRPGLIDSAMRIADVGGRVVVVGLCASSDRFMPWFGLHKELDLRFAIYYGAEDFTDSIDGLERGSLDVTGLVTEEVPLETLPARFAALATTSVGGKAVVRP